MKHIYLITQGEYGNSYVIGFTKTKREAQKFCRDCGFKGSDEYFKEGERDWMEIERFEEVTKDERQE